MKIILYVKTHNKTGLKYFGKSSDTIDQQKYLGSGKYWCRHLKKHGKDIKTEIVGKFDSMNECEKFAVKFSIDNNIVESEAWANLKMENGRGSAPLGIEHDIETRKKISASSKEHWKNHRDKIIESQKNSWTEDKRLKYSIDQKKLWTPERKKSHSEKIKGNPGDRSQTGIPKPKGFGKLISKALSGKPKSPEHMRALSLSRQSDKRTFIDHLGCKYELHSDFSNKYGVNMNTFRDLDAKIVRHTPVYEKLNIDFSYAKNKTKRELGFRFE